VTHTPHVDQILTLDPSKIVAFNAPHLTMTATLRNMVFFFFINLLLLLFLVFLQFFDVENVIILFSQKGSKIIQI